MKSNFATAFGLGIAVLAVGVTLVLYMQRGSRMDLPGKLLKVRTAPLDENSSVVVIDFRATNPSDVLFMVRSVSVEMEDNQGKSYQGSVAADMDVKPLFRGCASTGPKVQ